MEDLRRALQDALRSMNRAAEICEGLGDCQECPANGVWLEGVCPVETIRETLAEKMGITEPEDPYPYETLRTSDKPLLSLDFDGVLHRYSRGYQDGTIYDDPAPGAREFCHLAQKHFLLVVHSARARTPAGRAEMRAWFKEHGFPEMPIDAEKPPAFLHLDDRAMTFTGTFPDPGDLLLFKHWTGAKWGDRR